MSRALAIASLVALLSSACEEQSVCAAACVHSLDIALHQVAWPDGEYTLIARYDAYQEHQVRTCTFTLPGGDDAQCVAERPDPWDAELEVGASVSLHLPEGPTRITLELRQPDEQRHMFDLAPAYAETELCGQTCRRGSVTASLD
jgi:hypothetical protein